MRSLRFLLIAIVSGALAGGVYFAGQSSLLDLREIVFYGNKYLSEERLEGLAGVEADGKIWRISLREVAGRFSGSSWVRDVSVRKQYPGRLLVRIEEAVPTALLEKEGALYLLDGEGAVLERIKGRPVRFLPVIAGDPESNRGAFSEAVRLAKVIRSLGLSTRRNRVEIAGFEDGAHQLTVDIDGLLVRVGEGEYQEKLSRLFELTEEIRKRNINVDYVDLRFANRVVVKPVAGVLR
jgi:cell division protein FtsQ